MKGQARLLTVLALVPCLLSLASFADAAAKAAPSTNKLVDLIQKKKYDDFIKELSTDDMDPNSPDSKGRLPLSEAVKTKDLKFVDALIQFGALANSKEPGTKASPIQFAFQNGLVDIAKTLLAYGADINSPDKAGAKPRQFAPSKEISELIKKWDEAGAQAFEDGPGIWMKAKNDKGDQYWFNIKTEDARWNTPPSCGWQRLEFQGQPNTYSNYVTGQSTHRIPAPLSWRFIRADGQDMWYNWRVNTTQLDAPDEMPEELQKEAKEMKNVRWYNPRTQEFTWEDPKYHTAWRELKDESGTTYWFNVVTGDSKWEAPEEMAWEKMPSEEHPGHEFFHNKITGEATWDPKGHHEWEKHADDL